MSAGVLGVTCSRSNHSPPQINPSPFLYGPPIHQFVCFFYNDTATPEFYTLSLHDALPIFRRRPARMSAGPPPMAVRAPARSGRDAVRSEEHTSELQSRGHLVCRLLLEKKKKKKYTLSHEKKKKKTKK